MLDILKKLFSSEEKEKDPICGMSVDPETALQATLESKQYYFCSQHCKNKFESQPKESATHKKDDGCKCC